MAAYLVVTDEGITAVDAGFPGFWRPLLRELTAIGATPGDIRGVVLTHGDVDHLGYAERLREGELVDPADFDLPVLDEPASGAWGVYAHEHTQRWSEAVASFDGYVFVTPGYNHGVSWPLKNGFVSYGVHGGVRAVEQLRQIAGDLKLADVGAQVALNTYTDFDHTGIGITEPTVTGVFAPDERHAGDLAKVLDQVAVWSRALAPVRAETAES
ncbi:NAD(P)H-dependent oxidoreductase [Streptomyces sp. PT12]|uniref:NAD(P)H-dependent oxidoreductase n=1 Tax=Streptomyces sp. PT12 TaxID=1510197 RepID=UPI0015EF1A3A|nr:NAD(P)H-dependent oxidoreductase [Streptomyces sp. PT12]